MNKVILPISLRKRWTRGPLAIAGLAVVVAAASAGVVIAQTRDARQQARVAGASRDGMQADMEGRIDRALSRTLEARAADGRTAVLADGPVGMVSAGMDGWAGPVTQDERQQVPRKLTSEERNQLRQEIRNASQEVYQPYRDKKR
ncbi:hypothetical protein [Pigmentiphaga litoralis]|uniref:Uncharacterized protein n=1 Tax=Pigmentiphaga litoralis TaxID=516702 RepID=A0A7Y9IWF7_9BURK|nr:hypothetical protein [Pigmentiphaga litoralis]NYE22035.1 hypothetical protein [Pigmentiphaga litoralis]NYE84350.1 hypothetical protein [Pigmentiphaga litoralis]